MSSKTVLKTLIDEMNVNMDLYGLAGNKAMLKAYSDIKARVIELLPKEKEDIMNAFDSGCELGIGYENAEDYFTNTFNQ